MRTILFILRKEFSQIFRNITILRMIIAMPLVQLIVLPNAADFEIKNIHLAIIDNDISSYSKELTNKIKSSNYFKLDHFGNSYKKTLDLVENNTVDLVLEIPNGFEKNLIREESQKLFISVNAINGTKANLGFNYLSNIIMEYNNNVRTEIMQPFKTSPIPVFNINYSSWFNRNLNYQTFMVPGILGILVTMVAGFLASLNIVKEKEMGTIEQINVSPIKKHHFILGKLIPFWVLGNVVFTLGLFFSWLIYGIFPLGNLFTLYVFIWIYLICILGCGLLVSTFCDTQQQAMLIMFFFLMVFILMSGLFTPVESMPPWAQVVTKINPLSYLIKVLRMVVLKGSSIFDLLPQFITILIFGIVMNGWAVVSYKKRG